MWTEERTGIGMHQESEERRERRGSGNQEHGPGSLGQTSVTRITDSSLPHSVFISGPMFPVKDSVALVAGRGILRRLHPTMAAAATRREYRGTSSQRIGIRSSLIRTGSLILLILSLMPQLFLAVSITDSMRETGSGSGSPEDEAIANSIQEVSLLAKASDDRWLLKEGNFVEEDPNLIIGLPNDVRITPEGDPIFEGDMVIPREVMEKMKLDNGSRPSIRDAGALLFDGMTGRTAIGEPMLYWPDGRVVYTFHSSVTPEERSVIESAIRHWEAESCITFREREPLDYYYLRFRTDAPGCWSLVGRQFLRFGIGQDISIGKGCAQLHVVVHEIGHALGFFHEQSRADRDSAIFINWENVQQGYELQFNKEDDINFGVGYDYLSTMQYPSWAFSKQALEKDTIVTMDPKYQRLLGANKVGLSFRDKAIMNRLYRCERLCSNQDTCQNNGYLRVPAKHMRNADERSNVCECQCPPNASGRNCEIITNPSYYDAIEPLPCGGNVTEEGMIETPNYPTRSAAKQSCVWNIVAPAGKKVSIQFLGFEFAPRYNKPGSKVNGKCYHETIEIRLTDAYHGEHFCGTDIAPGTTMMSTRNRAIIMIMADEKMIGKGLRANITFYDPYAPVVTPAPVPPTGITTGSGNTGPTVPVTGTTGDRTTGGSWNKRVKPITVPVKPPTTIVVPLPDNGFDEAWRKIIDSWNQQRVIGNRITTPPPIPLPEWIRVGG